MTSTSGVTGTVAVQARQSVEETEWLCGLAEKDNQILGVVGWVPLIQEGVRDTLDELAHRRVLKGVRHVLHDEEDDEYMLRPDFNRGLSLLHQYGLCYDLLIFERHLPQTIRLVDQHPKQIFILDHLAKPLVMSGSMSPWKQNLQELSQRDNVYCKLSGLVTEAHWRDWKTQDLGPYIETVLELFGPPRTMFGSDWPVLTLAASYERWLEIVRSAIRPFSLTEQHSVLAGTAIKAYNLSL